MDSTLINSAILNFAIVQLSGWLRERRRQTQGCVNLPSTQWERVFWSPNGARRGFESHSWQCPILWLFFLWLFYFMTILFMCVHRFDIPPNSKTVHRMLRQSMRAKNLCVSFWALKHKKTLEFEHRYTGRIFSQPLSFSFKCDKNIGNVSEVHSQRVIKSELLNVHMHDAKHVLSFATLRNCRDPGDPLRSLIIYLYLGNVIYCTTCTLCKKLYFGETGRRLGNQFREHLGDAEKDDKNASKSVARHFNLLNHSKQHMAVCGLSLHQGSTESRKTLEQKFIL